jgi:hypothetical protein
VAKVKLDVGALQAYLAEGHSQADAARHFNVSQAAISLRVRQNRLTTTKVVALERAHEVVTHQLSAAQRLERVQHVILGQLDWAEAQAEKVSHKYLSRIRTQASWRKPRKLPTWYSQRVTRRREF